LDEDLKIALAALFREKEEANSGPVDGDSIEDLDTLGSSIEEPESETIDNTESQLPDLDSLITEAYNNDRIANQLIAAKRQGLRRLLRNITDQEIELAMGDLEEKGDRLWVRGRLYIPDDKPTILKIMELYHSNPITGRPGIRGMYRQIIKHFYWPKYTNCPSSSEVTTVMNETSSVIDEGHGGQEISGAMAMGEPTKQMVEHWTVTRLTGWLETLDPPLNPKNLEKIIDAEIDGRAFLAGAGDRDFFIAAGFSFGASVNLANLAKNINSTAIQGRLPSFIPYSKH
jgi:hypothetical protein